VEIAGPGPQARELHFGSPFLGFRKAVPVYETDSVDDTSCLELDLFRIPLPPPNTHRLGTDFRGRFTFEFIVLPAEKTFELRKRRAGAGTHHVDEGLTLSRVREELEFYRQLALFFHQSGMSVYVCDGLGGRPKRIVEEASSTRLTLESGANSSTVISIRSDCGRGC
jgi:hypothetical protein